MILQEPRINHAYKIVLVNGILLCELKFIEYQQAICMHDFSYLHIDGLMQDCGNSIANAVEQQLQSV